MTNVVLPLTGTTGASNATVATETLTGAEYQLVKLIAGTAGSSAPVASSTSVSPSSDSMGLVVRTLGSSAGTTGLIGSVALVSGTSSQFQFVQTIPFSSGNVSRTSVATSVDASVIAANANRKGLVIANGSTAQMVGIGLTTATMTTARANVNLYLLANSQITFGLPNGNFPLYLGPVRGINLTSTTVTGGVIVTEFT